MAAATSVAAAAVPSESGFVVRRLQDDARTPGSKLLEFRAGAPCAPVNASALRPMIAHFKNFERLDN